MGFDRKRRSAPVYPSATFAHPQNIDLSPGTPQWPPDTVAHGFTVELGQAWKKDGRELQLFPEHGMLYVAGMRTWNGPGLAEIVRGGPANLDQFYGSPLDVAAFNPEAVAGVEDLKAALALIDETLAVSAEFLPPSADAEVLRRRQRALRRRLERLCVPEPPEPPQVPGVPPLTSYSPTPEAPEYTGEPFRYVKYDLGVCYQSQPLSLTFEPLTDQVVTIRGALVGVRAPLPSSGPAGFPFPSPRDNPFLR